MTCETTIIPLLSPEYLWCFTLQSPPEKQLITRGLQTILYLDNFGYNEMPVFEPNILRSQSIGVRVVIHPRGTLPDIKKGFNVGPGLQTDIRLSAIRFQRMQDPYGKCTEQESLNEMANIQGGVTGITNSSYTQESCLNACYQDLVMGQCGCMAAHLAITEGMWKSGNVPFCQMVDIEVDKNPTPEQVFAALPQVKLQELFVFFSS